MVAVHQHDVFSKWLNKLRDVKVKAQIFVRIQRIEAGNFGDHKSVGGGVSELRFTTGPAYRVYYTLRDGQVVILLCGGDKSTQEKDITKAKEIAASLG